MRGLKKNFKIKKYQFEWAPNYYPARDAHMFRAGSEWVNLIQRMKFTFSEVVYRDTHAWERPARCTLHNEKSNKMQQRIKILLFQMYMKLNMFRATHRPSSGA
jgi:hypothetical protein